jgi:hypothetical protein
MALQTIFLGTPNNNDGDSLYAGGTKINANFSELYTQLAGSPTGALRIDLGTPLIGAPAVGDVLGWSPANNQFIPSSSTMLKTLSGNGSSVLILTNNTGKAGPDEEYTSIPNALEMILNGRRMWGLVATTTGSTAATRGTWYIGMGNPLATSLAISARGVAVAGVDSLTVYRQVAEENSVSSLMLSTGSSGIILHRTPIINSDFYKDPSDSSGAVIHSGFVQQAISQRGFADGTSVIVGARGVAGGGSLADDRQLVTDMRFFNDHITGLSYNFRGSPARVIVSPGSAAHYSFSVSSATTISSTEVRAFAASTAEMNRAWNNDAAWNDSNTQACLDTIVANTWYYLYLVANTNNGSTDFVVTDSRTYSVVESKLAAASGGAAFSVIRRIGAFRTSSTSIDPLPFVTHSRGRDIKFDFAFHGTGPQHGIIDYATTISSAPVTTAAITIGLLTTSVATTASIALYSSVLIRGIPPLPGVTADLNIIHFTTRVFNAVAFCGEPWASSAATVYGATGTGAPTEIVKEVVASVTSISRRTISISPTAELITDGVHAGSTVWNASSGTNIRYAIVNQSTAAQALTETAPPTLLGWDVRGFTIER